jgi:hypothetical protein
VRRELNRLEEIKLVSATKRGNRRYYLLNQSHPYFEDLMGLVHKTFGLGGDIVKAGDKLGEIKYALLTSSYTRGIPVVPNDVDLIIVGNANLNLLSEIINNAEKRIGKEVNYTVLTDNEFDIRKKRRDAFVYNLIAGDNVLLIGDRHEFTK